MKTRVHSALLLASLCLAAAPALAASDCQPLFDAYAAQMQLPIFKRVVTTPGMDDAVEQIVTVDALFSRVGAKDAWNRVPLNAPTRTMMLKGIPTEASVTECRKVGAEMLGDVATTAYEFEFIPSIALGSAPDERLTVLIGDASGLPLRETALKAGTSVIIVYDGVTEPQT